MKPDTSTNSKNVAESDAGKRRMQRLVMLVLLWVFVGWWYVPAALGLAVMLCMGDDGEHANQVAANGTDKILKTLGRFFSA